MIYYVRHGQTINNLNEIFYDDTAGPGLTDTGVAQAEATAAKLKDVHFDLCYCSPLKRAQQTAQIITKYHPGLNIITDDRLKERSYAALGGKPFQSVADAPLFAQRWHRDSATYPGVESIDACFARVKAFFDATSDPTKNILVVAHHDLYRLVYCYFHGFPASGNLREIPHLDNGAVATFA